VALLGVFGDPVQGLRVQLEQSPFLNILSVDGKAAMMSG